MIPDAPLPPWVLACASYDGAAVEMWGRTWDGDCNFTVGRLFDGGTFHRCMVVSWSGDDEAEARAVWEREAERLRT